jgi:hypothetical protein
MWERHTRQRMVERDEARSLSGDLQLGQRIPAAGSKSKHLQIYAEPMPSISKFCGSQCKAFANNVLAVLWDFRRLPSSKPKINIVQIFDRRMGSTDHRAPIRLGKSVTALKTP